VAATTESNYEGVLPSAQRIFDAARFLVALGNRASVAHAGRLQRLIATTPSAAIEAYHHARHGAGTSRDARDREVYESVALAVASNAATVGVVVD
jgi:hypothetical protein